MQGIIPRSILCAALSGPVMLAAPSHLSAQVVGAPQQGALREKDIPEGFTRQDWLRGTITPERAWWDLQHYDLSVQVFPESKSLKGSNIIAFHTLAAGDRMQVDLQPPLEITKVLYSGSELSFTREGNVYWIDFPQALPADLDDQIQVFYEGVPVEGKRPPWSGGLTWAKDDLGKPFLTTTCQGIGASIWWPNKDHGYDEPDRGVDTHFTVPQGLVAVSNGRLIDRSDDAAAKTSTFHWRVTNPINNYSVNMNIGNYVHMDEVYEGEYGKLDCQYWVLEQEQEKAKEQFKQVPMTLAAFEHFFGKYPFYEDSYKLVSVPYLGMEHQSSVTYGNGFKNGYRGRDLSGTGIGLKFDYIIIHESAHEWWGNNISMKDAADMWIHESFATYAEGVYVEYHFGKQEAADYLIGLRKGIGNKAPIIGRYGLNNGGSGDMYPKGANMLHTMRQIVNDDAKWWAAIKGAQQEFWHQTITTAEFEAYFSRETGFDFSRVFDQYLRTAQLPLLRHAVEGHTLTVWFEHVVPGFRVPVVLHINGKPQRAVISEKPTKIKLDGPLKSFELDRNYYMDVE